MAGLERQDKDFWRYIIGHDFIGLCETWVMENEWKYIKEKLPRSHIWFNKNAIRKKERGRTYGGMLIGLNKDWKFDERKIIGTKREGIMHLNVREKREVINILTVYNLDYQIDIGNVIKKEIEECENEEIIIGGDFNIKNRRTA